ncbi:fungal hydrophobin [Lentinus tigrinus ALCF2SS1-7]|uniref:Hydrophobin n=1 Tax=Lentinus tigrinus ALCF2SS1-6 TaxID=1328759 RepID=A0A5C2RUG4_9APHY|nr:fungal hydrophobin [Lentinus tigrinus ALCF2SS1-6]RPD71285.1 fungal hydrophobin [Lentinus tigrinus ALCF2SS1-7]
MMLSRAVALAIAAMPLLAAANPVTTRAGTCSTGSLECCNNVEKAGAPSAAAILGLLGIVVQDLNVLVGLTCSPITVIGVGGGECSATSVCCEDNSHGGLISIGCVPVTL